MKSAKKREHSKIIQIDDFAMLSDSLFQKLMRKAIPLILSDGTNSYERPEDLRMEATIYSPSPFPPAPRLRS